MTEIVEGISDSRVSERHVSTIGIAVIIAILLWVGNSILDQGTTQGLMRGDLKVMGSEITHLRETVKLASVGNYSIAESIRDRNECNLKLGALSTRIANNTDRVLLLEKKHRGVPK